MDGVVGGPIGAALGGVVVGSATGPTDLNLQHEQMRSVVQQRGLVRQLYVILRSPRHGHRCQSAGSVALLLAIRGTPLPRWRASARLTPAHCHSLSKRRACSRVTHDWRRHTESWLNVR